MMQIKLVAGLMAGLIITSNSLAENDHHREHGAHTHGLAQLNIALDGNTLALELESPAINIVGFEHKPRSSQEHDALKSAMALLRKPDALFVTDAAANCKAGHVEVHSSFEDTDYEAHQDHDEEHHAEEKHHDVDDHGNSEEHSDIEAHYELSCVNTDKLKIINVRLFEKFPAMHNIALQFIGERGQTSVQLDHDAPIFKLPR